MVYQKVLCRHCLSDKLIKAGFQSGKQRVRCKSCKKTFQMSYTYEACKAGVVDKIEQMAHNGNGVRDTARLLKINKNTVLSHLKKSCSSPES